MKTVLFIGPAPQHYGGISIHIRRLTKLLEDDISADYIDESRIRIKGIYNLRSLNLFTYFRKILKTDVVHINSGIWSLRLFNIFFAKFIFNKHTIVTVHRDPTIEPHLKLTTFMLRCCDHVIMVNVKGYDAVSDTDRCRFHVIPAFLPPILKDEPVLDNEISKWIKSIRKNPDCKLMCSNASVLVLHDNVDLYGLDLCIDAMIRLKDKKTRYYLLFVIASNFDQKDLLLSYKKKISDNAIGDRILIWEKPTSFVRIIEKSDVVLRTTNTDGDAISIREALHFNKVVIASDVVERPDGVYIFKTRNLDDLVKVIEDSNRMGVMKNSQDSFDYRATYMKIYCNNTQIRDSFIHLKNYCESENFKGWDPYDGLNSKVFKAVPFISKSPLCRLAMIQCFKRSPINLRRLFMVPKEYNPKALGLFLQAYCNLYQSSADFNKVELCDRIREISKLLISLKSKGNYHGACWGYNFDWQARRLFFFPAYTPTVVATYFCASALFKAYEITKEKEFFSEALSSAEFVLNDLHRTEYAGGFLFSYSPLPGNDTVYNASLLGSALLSICYKYSGDQRYKEAARSSVIACCNGQKETGAWVYGMLPVQSWVDSFHTGYNLDALCIYSTNCQDDSFQKYLDKGLQYYLNNFFLANGTPRYYDNSTYPIDIHCPAQLFVTLSRMHLVNENKTMINSVLDWTLNNMQDDKGFFYYQIKKGMSSKISYMRWSNAFMFYALSFLILENYE